MEQFDECGSLVHGGEMVRLANESTKTSLLENQLSNSSDIASAKAYFGQFEPTSAVSADLPPLTIDQGALPTIPLDGLTPDAGPTGLFSGLFEILTEILTAPPIDPTQMSG